MSEEIWKDIPNFEGLYKVSNTGNIMSLYTNKILKPSKHKDGYLLYNLHKNKKSYLMTGHRAVALTFIPNPENLPLINHKDENPSNNNVDNLEWCSHLYNNLYSNNGRRSGNKRSIKVYCYDINYNEFIFDSQHIAAKKLNTSSGNVNAALIHKEDVYNSKDIKCIKGYILSYDKLIKDDIDYIYNIKRESKRYSNYPKIIISI